jgi:Glutathione S-transferase
VKPTLVIGNKNYSSWSLRPWFLLKHFGVDFQEVRVPLNQPETADRLAMFSPTGKVPVLLHEQRAVWESLAICEYINDCFLDGRGWPADLGARSHARSLACEMHAGFAALRSQWPMNVRLRRPRTLNGKVAQDLARMEVIWNECLEIYGGPWMCGEFSIVDAMYAPVALRFHSYQPPLSEASQGYVKAILSHPAIKEWMAAAEAESEVIKEDEVGYLLGEPGWE